MAPHSASAAAGSYHQWIMWHLIVVNDGPRERLRLAGGGRGPVRRVDAEWLQRLRHTRRSAPVREQGSLLVQQAALFGLGLGKDSAPTRAHLVRRAREGISRSEASGELSAIALDDSRRPPNLCESMMWSAIVYCTRECQNEARVAAKRVAVAYVDDSDQLFLAFISWDPIHQLRISTVRSQKRRVGWG